MGKFSRLGNDLYGGRRSIDFVGRRPLWYAISTALVLAAIAIVLLKGLNFGIEFTGGTQYRVPLATSDVSQATADELRDAVSASGPENAETATVTTSGDNSILIQTEELTREESDTVSAVIEETVSIVKADGSPGTATEISQDEIGASWGSQVAKQAVIGVIVFLVLVMLFIGFYFREWKMALAAFVALFHDIAITVGVYALSGFQVTPSAVTGLLAILGFSLYDTVVVFDKVNENSHAMRKNRQTYSEAANLAVNQTLVRSINTGIVALIPIGAILYVSTVQLGASSLQDLALSQFVGMAVGVYSSIYLAPRVLVHLKSNESDVVLAEKRAKARSRAAADRYATVPAFVDDMPVQDDPGESDEGADHDDEVAETSPRSREQAPRASDAVGKGRVVPPSRGPMGESKTSGRQQPSRQTKSQREK